jgi:molybdopterin biosynthesis enzyme
VFDLLVRPMLLRMLGQDPEPWQSVARLRGSWKPNARLQATPVRLHAEGGELIADLLPPSPSGDPFSLVGGVAYALIPGGEKPGERAMATIVGYSSGMPWA